MANGGGGVLIVQCGGAIDKDYPSKLHGYDFVVAGHAAERVVAEANVTAPTAFATVLPPEGQADRVLLPRHPPPPLFAQTSGHIQAQRRTLLAS